MMDKDTAAEMIQAKALGCLDGKDRKELNEFLNLGGEFPWKDFGEYQNLAALLPIILEIEAPDVSVKDKVAQKIYAAIAEIKAKKDAEKGIKKPEYDIVYPETTVLGDQILPDVTEALPSLEDLTETIELAEPLNIDEVPVSGDLTASIKEELTDTTINQESEILYRQEIPLGAPDVKSEEFPDALSVEELVRDNIPPLDTPPAKDESLIEEKMEIKEPPVIEKKEPVKSKYRELQEERTKRKPVDEIPLKKEKFVEPAPPAKKGFSGIVVDIIIYVLLLAAIAFVYLKLSSEIDSLKKEIQDLKRNTGSVYTVPDSKQNYLV